MKITLSKNQWKNMGKKAGWIKEGQSSLGSPSAPIPENLSNNIVSEKTAIQTLIKKIEEDIKFIIADLESKIKNCDIYMNSNVNPDNDLNRIYRTKKELQEMDRNLTMRGEKIKAKILEVVKIVG